MKKCWLGLGPSALILLLKFLAFLSSNAQLNNCDVCQFQTSIQEIAMNSRMGNGRSQRFSMDWDRCQNAFVPENDSDPVLILHNGLESWILVHFHNVQLILLKDLIV